jgi:hypothetical protein
MLIFAVSHQKGHPSWLNSGRMQLDNVSRNQEIPLSNRVSRLIVI